MISVYIELVQTISNKQSIEGNIKGPITKKTGLSSNQCPEDKIKNIQTAHRKLNSLLRKKQLHKFYTF